MKVLVFGATGKTGGQVVEKAFAAGHDVSVLVRDPSKITRRGVQVFKGNATNPGDVRKAMAGQDAVIDTIGGTTPYKSTTLETDAVKAILAAMKAERTGKLIVVSALGVGDSIGQSPWWYRYLVVPTFLRASTKDKAAMEEEVRSSALNFLIVRPPMLVDAAPLGRWSIYEPGQTAHKITRSDLAAFLVEQLTSETYSGQAVTVVNS